MCKTELLTYLQGFVSQNRRERFEKILDKRTRHFVTVIEDVYHLHNTSAVLRSNEVFGIQDLHIIDENLGQNIDKKIALGAEKWVRVIRHASGAEALQVLKKEGYQLVATVPHTNAVSLEDFDISKKSALLFGTEKEGLSDQALAMADVFLNIPMVGFTQSLNISVATGIILQNLTSRLRSSHIQWQLSTDEKSDLEMQWHLNSIKNVEQIISEFQKTKLNPGEAELK